MLKLIYSLLLTLVAPFLLYSLYKKKPGKPAFKGRWKEHFGFTPALEIETQPIWIHAVSVGEVIAVIPLIKQLKNQHANITIVVTTTTSTGAQQVAKIKEFAEHRYMPIDFSFAVKRFISIIKPQQFIIMETELWPNTLAVVNKAEIPITVINARLSQRSYLRYKKVQLFFNLLAQNIDHILCQTSEDAQRFNLLGINPQKVTVTGSMKFDISISKAILHQGEQLRQKLGSSKPVWIAASTHIGEDQQLLAAHRLLLTHIPNALLILVPRHPERFTSTLQLSQQLGFNSLSHSSHGDIDDNTQVYLGDTMGEMLTFIEAADICFMAGSLIGDKVGGHNILEPAALAKPILNGPSYYNFTEITQQLIAAQACTICANEQQISERLITLFNDKELQQQQGQSALNIVNKNRGAIEKTIAQLPDIY